MENERRITDRHIEETAERSKARLDVQQTQQVRSQYKSLSSLVLATPAFLPSNNFALLSYLSALGRCRFAFVGCSDSTTEPSQEQTNEEDPSLEPWLLERKLDQSTSSKGERRMMSWRTSWMIIWRKRWM